MSLPFDLSPGAAAFMAVAFLVAAFVRGYSGFGFSALVVTASSLVTNPLYFVAVVMFCEFLMTFQQWRGVGKDVDWKRVGALMLGGIIGVPLGLWAITQVPVDTARAVIAGYVLLMCACWPWAGNCSVNRGLWRIRRLVALLASPMQWVWRGCR